MKKVGILFLLAVLAFSSMGCDACKENVLDKTGDWFATMGKDGIAKDQVLAERKADRASKCAQQKSAELKKKMGF